MASLASLRNLGPASAGWLAAAGIHTRDDLEALGAVEAYRRVKADVPDRVTLHMLYALQGALLDIPWNALPREMRARLKQEVAPA